MIIYLTCGVNTLKKIIIEGMPNKIKLKQILNAQFKTGVNDKISKKIEFENKSKNQILNKNNNKLKNTKNSQVNYYNFIYGFL